jgi:hypothetical protein
MTTKAEKAVRDAAAALDTAIAEAEAAGLSITWPRQRAGLAPIAISATAKAPKPEPVKPVTATKEK